MDAGLEDDELKEARRAWGVGGVRAIADTATSRVYRVDWSGGDAVLKILKPYGADEMSGIGFLASLKGQGAARIYRIGAGMALMEHLDGPTLGERLRRDGDDRWATDILCAVAGTLHGAAGHGAPELERLDSRFAPLFATAPADWPGAARGHLAQAQDLARKRLDATEHWRPLHGDFHHDNVMASARGWLAIDAKGVLGDRAYDFANVFLNPFGMSELTLDTARIRRLGRQIAAATGLDEARLLEWAAAHCALSACWNLADGGPVDFQAALLPRLLDAVDQSRFSKKKSG